MVAVIAMPFVVRGLGTERFGLLSLAWVVMGYFTIFDLGLGRATTKFVAEALGKGEGGRVSQIIWTAVTVQAIMGAIGALALFLMTDYLVERVLNIPPALIYEAEATFRLLAFAIPLVLLSSSFSGVMEAAQRFDLVNSVKIPTSTLTYLIPLIGLYLGFGLSGIVLLILIARVGALVALAAISIRTNPGLRKYSFSVSTFSHLFAYGGWIAVTSIVGPILIYLDRFLIGSLITIAAVAYYTVPYEAVTRLWLIPASLTMTLFPAFSSLESIKDNHKLGTVFARSIKYVLLSLGPILVFIALFAGDILRFWMGDDFAAESTIAMQLLAFAVLINSIANMPFALIQGVGRPDITAKFQLLELFVYIVVAWFLIGKFGIAGAAGAWTIRVVLDALLLFTAAFKVCRFSPTLLAENGMTPAVLELMMLACIGYGLKAFAYALPFICQSLLFIGIVVAFIIFAWNYVLDDLDQGLVINAMKPKITWRAHYEQE